jgi:hypothetical protein
VGTVNHVMIPQEEIQVAGARAVARLAGAAEGVFHVLQDGKQGVRRAVRVQFQHRVQKRSAFGPAPGLAFVQRGRTPDGMAARVEAAAGRVKGGFAVSEVGTEADVGVDDALSDGA